MNKKRRLAYVLPTYDANVWHHFYHLYAFLEELSTKVDLHLYVEKGECPRFGRAHLQRFSFFPLRVIEILWWTLKTRLSGAKIFYTHYSYFGACASGLVTRLLGGRSFYWHCAVVKEMVPWAGGDTLRRKISTLYPLLLSLRLVHHLVEGTPYMADYFARNFGVRRSSIRVIPNWVDLERMKRERISKEEARKRLGLPHDRPIVLYLHRMVGYRGSRYLPSLLEKIRKSLPECLLVAGGDGSDREWLVEETERRGLKDHLRVVGAVPNRETSLYYRAADVFINPACLQAFDRVLIEAMALGTPLVTMEANGAVYDILSENQKAIVVKDNDTETFAKRVIDLLTDSDLRETMVKEGNERVLAFDRPRVEKIFMREILGES